MKIVTINQYFNTDFFILQTKRFTLPMKFTKQLLLLVGLQFITNFITGQDSLVNFNQVKFSSELERASVYNCIHDNNADYFDLFYEAAPNCKVENLQNAKNRFDTYLLTLNNNKFKGLKPDKKIKAVYKSVQDQFFKKYEFYSTFNQIFDNGTFNCVTGTSLYGQILSKLNISFEIKETPNHVYLVSYPQTLNIKVESTDPLQGYISYTDKFKSEMIDYLKKNKLIDEQEANSKTVNDLFNTYYYSDSHLSLRELAGLQYFNNAVNLVENKNTKGAITQLEIAYLLYPAKKIEFSLLMALSEVISQMKYDSISDVGYFVKLSKYIGRSLTVEQLKSEFARITQLQLVEKSRSKYYKEIYTYLDKNITNKELRTEISVIYNYETGRFLYNHGSYEEGRESFANAFRLKPENSDIRAAFTESLFRYLPNVDPSKVVETIENYFNEFPILKENKLLMTQLVLSCLYQSYMAFKISDIRSGEFYLEKFENYQRIIQLQENLSQLIFDTYSSAAAYYFKRNNSKKAREYVNRGLKIDPSNMMLKNLLNNI